MEEAEPPESEDEEQYTQRPDGSMKKKVSPYVQYSFPSHIFSIADAKVIAYSSICKSFISVLGWLMPKRF
jgi:hypothetical protein